MLDALATALVGETAGTTVAGGLGGPLEQPQINSPNATEPTKAMSLTSPTPLRLQQPDPELRCYDHDSIDESS